jgi:hypothetical protein
VGAGGIALVEQVVAVLADGGGLAAGVPEPTARLTAAAGGAPRTGQEQGQPEQGEYPDHDDVKEQRVGAGAAPVSRSSPGSSQRRANRPERRHGPFRRS